MSELDVIIPAGGKIDGQFSRIVGTDRKPLITLQGETVIERTIKALRDSKLVRRIVVVGPNEVLAHSGVADSDGRVPEGTTGPQNIYKGLDWLMSSNFPPERVMIVTADLPFVTGETFRAFEKLCPPEGDFCVPLVSEESFHEGFPRAPATFVTLQDGTWTTGCAYIARTQALIRINEHVDRIFQRRKSKIGMARLLGFGFVWSMFAKKLKVSDVELKVQELLNCRGMAVPGSPAELAFDIDYVDDYYFALSLMKGMSVKPTTARR